MTAAIPFTLYSTETLEAIDRLVDSTVRTWFRDVFAGVEVKSHPLQDSYRCSDKVQQAWDYDTENEALLSEALIVKLCDKSIAVKLTSTSKHWLSLLGYNTEAVVHQDELHCMTEVVFQPLIEAINALSSNTQQESEQVYISALASPWVKGTGVVYKQFALNGLKLELLLHGGLLQENWGQVIRQGSPVSKDRAENHPLVNRIEASKKLSVNLTASLGEAEVSIGELNKIEVGDVVTLDKSFTSQVEVLNVNGQVVCRGNLGKKDQCRAVILTSS